MEPQTPTLYEHLKTHLKTRLVDVLELDVDPTRGLRTDQGVLRAQLRQILDGLLVDARDARITFSESEQARLIEEALHDVVGLGPLDSLLSDETISEIMVNGPHEIFVERNGHLQRIPETFRDNQHLLTVIERILQAVGLSVNESDPLCDARLGDGSRINIIIPPLVLNGPVMTIRRKLRAWTMEGFVATGALSQQAAEFLKACVRAKVNLVFSGGTSTGKTTLVGLLSNYIPLEERIITIENISELELHEGAHWIRLVTKAANLEGHGEIPLRVLVKNALRMRPDRIILGEARGGEALDAVQAMHLGHDGFMTVLHANSAHAALERLQMMMLMSGLEVPPEACRTQIASAVELIVHMGRYADGSRRVAAISQVLGTSAEGFMLEELFVFEGEGFTPEGKLLGSCRYTGARPKFLQRFMLNNVPLPTWLKT